MWSPTAHRTPHTVRRVGTHTGTGQRTRSRSTPLSNYTRTFAYARAFLRRSTEKFRPVLTARAREAACEHTRAGFARATLTTYVPASTVASNPAAPLATDFPRSAAPPSRRFLPPLDAVPPTRGTLDRLRFPLSPSAIQQPPVPMAGRLLTSRDASTIHASPPCRLIPRLAIRIRKREQAKARGTKSCWSDTPVRRAVYTYVRKLNDRRV